MGVKQKNSNVIEEGWLRVSVPVALRTDSLTLRLFAAEQELSRDLWITVPAGRLAITMEIETLQACAYARAQLSVDVEVKSNEAVSVSFPEANFLRTMLKVFPFLPLDVVVPCP